MTDCIHGTCCHFRYQPSHFRQTAQRNVCSNRLDARFIQERSSHRTCTAAASSSGEPSTSGKGGAPKKRAARPKRSKQQAELQDLMIDPEYDPLFDGIDEDEDEYKDPFVSSSRKGRPPGSAKRSNWDTSDNQKYLPTGVKLDNMAAKFASRGYDVEEDDLSDFLEEDAEKEEDKEYNSHFKQHLKYTRWAYIQKEQDEVIHIHHELRKTTVPAFGQAIALANLMQALERQDEQDGETDPIPSFLRAKKLLAENWHVMEELNGSREDTLESIFRFGKMTEERQHLLDTWDPSIYEGVHDDEGVKPPEDFLSSLLALPESGVLDVAQQEEEEFMQDIMPDLDDLMPDQAEGNRNGAAS